MCSNFIYYGVGIINRVCRCERLYSVVCLPQKIASSEIVDDDMTLFVGALISFFKLIVIDVRMILSEIDGYWIEKFRIF